jgi:single-strand DNA-binding protein
MDTINVCVLRGPVSAPPEVRRLESGTVVASFSIRTAGANGKGISVPVTVWDPATWVETLSAGDNLIVVGRVRRRFFQTGTGTPGARTDVEVETVARASERKRLAAIVRRIDAALEGLVDVE